MTSVNPPKLSRRERAAATRARMLRAGTEVFIEAGYAGARMADIAERADVAVQTLYYTFSTKGDLLQACIHHAVLGLEELPPQRQPFWGEMNAARSGRQALAAFVRGNTAILLRAAELDEVQKAAAHEPDAAKIAAKSHALRRRSQSEVVSMLADRFNLRAGLDLDTAADVFVTLCGSELYLSFKRCGWPEDKYAAWLTDTLATQLLARPARS